MPPLPCPDASKKGGDVAVTRFDVGKMPPILTKRADFLAAAKAGRRGTPGFLLQARNRRDDDPARVGFTCSKKIGNAVTRNRAKRRLREIARLHLPELAQAGWDYVLIGRPGVTVSRDFADLSADLCNALRILHK